MYAFRWLILYAALAFACVVMPAASPTAWACSSVKVSGANNWFPVIMRTEDAESVHGLAPDVAYEVFGRLDIDVIVDPDRPFKRLLVQLERGELDVILGAYWNRERAEKYYYSEPFATDEIAIFVRKEHSFPLQSLGDLIGRLGIRPLGGSYGQRFDAYAAEHLDIEQIATTGENTIIVMLGAGRADYAVLGRFDGIADIRDSGLVGKVIDLPWPVASNDVHFLFSRKSDCAERLDEINQMIRTLREEGFIDSFNQKYLN